MDRKEKKDLKQEKEEYAKKVIAANPPEKGDFIAMVLGAWLALMPVIIIALLFIAAIILLVVFI